MRARFFKLFYILLFFFVAQTAYAQQDIDFHLNNTFLSGKNIIKVKRDFNDPYLWVLTQNSEVYRINSETLVVDDYTPKFAAYNNLPFLDIAGSGKEEVFIAQKDKILRYENGVITIINSTNGLRGEINAIGFDQRGYNNTYDYGANLYGPLLMVTTNITLDYYYIGSRQFRNIEKLNFLLKLANYKSTFLFDPNDDMRPASNEGARPMWMYANRGAYGGYIFLNDVDFGTQLKAIYSTGGLDDQSTNYATNYPLLGNQFWATEKGLFQNRWDRSYNLDLYGYHHYLENNHINQITSILGLTSFGFTSTRENLLLATDEGLYISNSKYYPQQIFPTYEFYHYAGLGNKKINYLDVNATRISPIEFSIASYCENGVWVGTTDGLYLIKPDYTNYFDQGQQTQAISFEGKSPNETTLQLCPGVTTKANIYIPLNASVQWYKNGQELANQSEKSLEISSAGEYYAVLYDPCSGLHVQTNHLTVNYLTGNSVPLNYPDKMSFCYGSTASLSVPNNPDFKYRWYKDGVLNGITTPQIDITEDGKYKLEVNNCQDVWISTKEVEIKFIKIPIPGLTTDKTIICAGEEATLTAALTFNATGITNWAPYTYRWFKDGVLLPVTTTPIFKATVTGNYKVEATSCAGNSATSAEVFINVITLPDPLITSVKDSYCAGETAQLNTNVVLNATYDINWYNYGVLMPGSLNQTSIMVNQEGSYTMSVTSKLTPNACVKIAAAKQIAFVPFPTFTFNYADVLTKCTGDVVNLKIQGSATYKYRWYKNGVLTGQTTSAIDVTDPGKYYADISVCENSWFSSKEIEVRFIQIPTSVIIASDKPAYCIGDNANLNLNIPASPDYNINWFIDGVPVSAWLNQTSVIASANGIYTVKINSSLISCEKASAPKQIVFSPKPQVEIQKNTTATICEGQSVELRVDNAGGSVKWSTGETTAKISVTHGGHYSVIYTSAGGCETEAGIDVSFFPKPVLNLFDGAICAFKKETLTLTAPAGYASYSWNNGQSVSQTFEVDKPQTVVLTVTDANNCRATQQIQVKNQCPDVHIANAFTPNNDGINDTWLVTGIETDPSVTVKVFNRGGSLVFESKGYTNPWNGTINGKKLSTGVYYYIITTKNSSEILKGSITIIY